VIKRRHRDGANTILSDQACGKIHFAFVRYLAVVKQLKIGSVAGNDLEAGTAYAINKIIPFLLIEGVEVLIVFFITQVISNGMLNRCIASKYNELM